MNKKILKKLYKVFALFVVVSMPIVTFSAGTSADGDAFITKEEFDVALSNFNQRLTVFEAGINSKIDSQVTSYLDRNGIWSPKSHAFSSTDFGFTGMSTDTANRWGTRWYVDSAGSWANSTTTSAKNIKNYVSSEKVIIDPIEKSGLMMLGFKGQRNGTNINVAPGNTSSTTAGSVPSDNVTLQYTEILEFWQSYVESGTTIDEYLYGVSIPAIVPVPGMILMQDYPATIVNFFVKKGAKLILKFKVDYIAINTVAWSANTLYHKWIGMSANVY